MQLSLGYSPCPNDCFIFDALIHQKIDTEGLSFTAHLEDVETLNQWAAKDKLDITKLSYFAYGHFREHYELLRSGSALGFKCGPLLISKQKFSDPNNDIGTVAIPGKLTTANFLFSLAYPGITEKKEMPFDKIEDAVLSGQVDAGLIIHENRFTYQEKGLLKIADLGEHWETLMHAPIPLGGIAMKRSFDLSTRQKVNRVIRRSVAFAFENPESSMPYVRQHAQTMKEEVMKNHIKLYVNEFSLDLGETGVAAVTTLFRKAEEMKILAPFPDTILLPE
jgi:1,4-dihydroxy-6-naphthoate synthase